MLDLLLLGLEPFLEDCFARVFTKPKLFLDLDLNLEKIFDFMFDDRFMKSF